MVKNYPCEQGELYSVCETIIGSLEKYLGEFGAYKGKYNAGFVDGLRLLLDSAQGLRDFQGRNADSEIFRIRLIDLNKKCLWNFRCLMGYIEGAFEKNVCKIQFEAAGYKNYAKAAQNNWEWTDGLNVSAKRFIAANDAVLQDGGMNMPAGFGAIVDADALAYSECYGDFLRATQTGVKTEAKVRASNDLYAAVMAVCRDGKRIFADDYGQWVLFVFARVLRIVTPQKSAGLRVLVLDNSGAVVKGAEFFVWRKAGLKRGRKGKLKIKDEKLKTSGVDVMMTAPYKNGVSGVDGVVLLKQLEAGVYLWRCSFNGVVVEGVKRVLKGATSRVKIKFQV